MTLPAFSRSPALYLWGFSLILCVALVAFMPDPLVM
jgi:hypothetical protein